MYIVIDNYASDGSKLDPTVYTVDTDEERDAARAALRERGVQAAPVYVGDPEDPLSYQTVGRLYA